MSNDDELISQSEAARLTGKSTRSIRRWGLAVAGERGKEVLYRREAVLEEDARRRDQNRRQHGGNIPPDIPCGGNVARILTWNTCVAVSETLQRCIAIAATTEDWKQRYEISDAQLGTLVANLAVIIPQIIDVFLSSHFDRWFERENDMTVDEMATKLLLNRFRIRSRPWKPGEFWEEVGKGPLPDVVQRMLTKSALEYARAATARAGTTAQETA